MKLVVTIAGVLAALALGGNSLQGAEPLDKFEARTFEKDGLGSIPYRLLSPPKIEEGQSYPIVLFLHGAGERGDDNKAQLVHVVKNLATDEMQQRYPCFVVVPQCPKEQKWVEIDWKLPRHDMPEKPSRPLSLALAIIDHLQLVHPIDKDRIYIAGLSMGGYGTWDAIQRDAGKYAAAIPICGGGDPNYAKEIGDLPVWVFHGDEDAAVPVGRSRAMVDALKETGNPVIYTEYPGVNHDSWTRTAENRLVWDWMFAQKRSSHE